MKSSTARPSSRLSRIRFIAGSALVVRPLMRSGTNPRVKSALTTLPAAPPRSEPGSGSKLPSARWAAAERMMDRVSESLGHLMVHLPFYYPKPRGPPARGGQAEGGGRQT